MPKAVMKLVQPSADPEPPADLGEAGERLWRAICRDFHVEDAAELSHLEGACRAADRASECRQRVEKEGLLVSSSHGAVSHPLARLELSALALSARLLSRVTNPPNKPGRPPGRAGGRWN